MEKNWRYVKKSALLLLCACFFKPLCLVGMMSAEEEQTMWVTQMTAQRSSLDSVNLAGKEPAVVASPLGVNVSPLIGRYASSGYDFALTNLVVRLPKRQLAKFPKAIREQLVDYSDKELSLFFMILNDYYLMNGASSRNLVFHAAAFPNATAKDDLKCESSMGLFEGQEVLAVDGDGKLPLDAWSSQAIIVHPAEGNAAFSPNNARFNINEKAALSSFYTAAHLPGHRATAAFIIILHHPNTLEALIFSEAQKKTSLEGFLSFLTNSDLNADMFKKIKSLLTYQEASAQPNPPSYEHKKQGNATD